MPPEPLPWERKEYGFKDHRKHERGDSLGGGGSSFATRWREPYHGSRDFSRGSPRRSLSGRSLPAGRKFPPGTIAWKKWNRPTSTKTGRSETENAGTEVALPLEKETPTRSPVASLASNESAPKKPRLGWGQGLAKYEKQKVVGSTEPSVRGISQCLSPSTPSSATCSSSPGTEDKLCSRVGNNDNDDLHVSSFPSFYEEILASLDNLEVNPISSLDSLLVDLFQSEDAFGGDPNLMRHSATNKLSKLKSHVSNAFEKIENKIDLLEKELKAITCDTKANAYQGSLKSEDDSASLLSRRPLDDLSNESKDLKDQQVKCIEESLFDDHEHRPSSRLDEHNSVVKETVLSTLEKELPVCGMEKMVSTLSSNEVETWKASILSEMENSQGGGKPMVPSEAESLSFMNNSVLISCGGMTQRKTESNLVNSIVDSNRNISKFSWEVFNTTFSNDLPGSDVWGFVNFTSCRKHELNVKEKLAVAKRQLKFRERVLTLKFRALHHLWREDLHLLSIKKLRTKSSKRTELSNRSFLNGSQKQRSSIRSQSALPGNITLVPTTEIMNFTSKFLLDSQIKICRNNLKMPAMLLNEKYQRYSKFVTHNGLIEDPVTSEQERGMINPWSHVEKEVFKEMLARYGKDFTKISSFLDHKTTADCIEFYYKSHKSESFKDVKKSLDLRKQQQSLPANTYLVASGKNWNNKTSVASLDLNWNNKTSVASLDLLGAASVMALHNQDTARIEKYAGGSKNLDEANEHTSAQERVAADVLAGICGLVSPESASPYGTSSIDPAKNMKDEESLDEEDTCSDEGCGELDSADWTDEEKAMFIQALSMYSKDFTSISSYMKTRSREQCKIFFSKARKCLSLDTIHQGCANGITPVSLTNGGRSDTDDACIAEMNSAICSTQSCSKIDEDVSQPLVGTNYEGIDHSASTDFHVKNDFEVNDYSASTDFQVKTERSNEQADNVSVRPSLADYRDEVVRQVSIVHDVKQAGSRDDLQSDVPLKENIITSSAIEAVKLHEAADSADSEAKIEGVNNVVSLAERIVSIRKSEQVEECLEGESNQQTASLVTDAGIAGCFPSGNMEKEVDIKPSLDREFELSNKKLINANFTANGDDPLWSMKDSVQSVPSIVSAPKANGYHHLTSDSNSQGQIQVDAHPSATEKPRPTLKQENGHSLLVNSFMSDPANICFGGAPSFLYETTLNFEEHGNNRHQNSIKRDLSQQYMLRNLPLSQVNQSMHILRGYPLQSLKQEANAETNIHASKKPSQLQVETMKTGAFQLNHLFSSDKHWDKSNVSTPHSVSAPLHSARSENQSDAEFRTCSKNAGAKVEEHKPGDVKLFGKILSVTSSSQKSDSSFLESDKKPSLPKMDSTLKMNPHDNVKSASQLVSNASACRVNLETTYGFWDGKRIQTGFSSLPDTAAMFLKYQGSPTIISHYPAKDGIPGCNGIVPEHQQSHVQQMSSNVMQIENIPELQKRTRTETIPGFQQQVRVMPLGTNMLGGGMLVGSGVVSDPVSALKMHFAARANLYGSDPEL
uniref:MYB protein n=1 Tax=Zingiber officinale TaxID=94328 RepID=A0AA50CBU5_ZINOF|nr:MYB protein [Zingiber officinale]